MEDGVVGVHIEGIDGEVVSGQVEGFEDLAEGEVLAVAEDDRVLREPLQGSSTKVKRLRTSGARFILDLMKRSRCFWLKQAEWWTCVSTLRTL
jgi:hypothetical protein